MGLFFVVREIEDVGGPFDAYRRLGAGPGVLLESARRSGATGRYSFAAKRPFLTFEINGRDARATLASGKSRPASSDPLSELQKLLDRYASPAVSDLPFAGGAVGYLSYEAKALTEPAAGMSDKKTGIPEALFLFFDEGVVFDHGTGKTHVFAGVTAGKGAARRAERKAGALRKRLLKKAKPFPKSTFERWTGEGIRSSLSAGAFMDRVRSAQDAIRRGDIYQANLSQRLTFPVRRKAEEVYAALKKINPSAFFGIFDAGDFQIVSGSPERLVRLEAGVLDTRPIAGTRRRGKDAKADRRAGQDLLLSEKERAEHVMLVDLERNDMGRVSEYGSVSVDELMAVEDYSHVKHIVSNVRGRLRKGIGAVEALKAFFPGGTITGAPKVRSMEIIDELEPVARGPYTGSLGYFAFSGNMDFNILIRSLLLRDGQGSLHVGAGIVADSDPRKEYDETLHKAQAVLAAVFGAGAVRRYYKKLGLAVD